MGKKVFDHNLSMALDRAIVARDGAKTKISYIYYAWVVKQLEKKIPIVAVKK